MGSRILVTGGAGFIGSNFIRSLLEAGSGYSITNLDAMTYAGVQSTVNELDAFDAHTFVRGDIRDPAVVDAVVPGHDAIVHFAAESHVDRSIEGPTAFFETNVVGTSVLLDAARRHGVGRFLHVSTDEVYGSIVDGFAKEADVLDPSSPYSASKAGSDLLVLSYATTFGFDVVVTRCTNNYGPYQFPEKVIPLFVSNLIDGLKVPLYGDGTNERDWLHVSDHCSALERILHDGAAGEIYNIGADAQLSNGVLTGMILQSMGLDDSWIEIVPDRKGHDQRYAVDSSKTRALGWEPLRSFEERLEETIAWYSRRQDWWRPLKEVS